MNREKKFGLDHLENHELTPKELAQKNWKSKKAKRAPRSPTKKEIHGHDRKTRVWGVRGEKSPNENKHGHQKI